MTTHQTAVALVVGSVLAFGSVLALAGCGAGAAAPAAQTSTRTSARTSAPAATNAAVVATRARTVSSSGGHAHPQPSPKVTTSYAELTDVWKTGPSSYALSYDRVDFLTGKAAAE